MSFPQKREARIKIPFKKYPSQKPARYLLKQVKIQISPIRVVLFNQFDFPIPIPLLNLFFSPNGTVDIVCGLEVNQPMGIILLRKSTDQIVLMFIAPFD